METTKFDIFLSYASRNQDAAKNLARSLTERGLSVWFDVSSIPLGDPFVDRIEEGLKDSNSIAVLIDGESPGPWQQVEIRAAIQEYVSRRVPVLPILLPGRTNTLEIPLLLKGFRWVDLAADYAKGVQEIVEAVGTIEVPSFQDLAPPLFAVEADFVQVLLSQFELTRSGTGVTLDLKFDYRTPTVTTREGRRFLRQNMSNFLKKSEAYQRKIDSVLLHSTGQAFNPDDEEFVFRYGSGGSLLKVNFEGIDYYCLFLRTVHPIGWNIANGGCDSLEELLNPIKTICRELEEELIVVGSDHWYAMETDTHASLDRPAFGVSREFWNRRFDQLNLKKFHQLNSLRIPISFIDGPDTLKIDFQLTQREISGVYVNITAEDFGIEVDKIAKLVLPPGVDLRNGLKLLDGEVSGGRAVDRAVGLFRTDHFESKDAGLPEHFYYSGEYYEGNMLPQIFQYRILYDIDASGVMSKAIFEELCDEFEKNQGRFPLCPIADRIIRRVGGDESD
ncbi:MAG: toll/interleukin-1 receptor domain-containing protein [Pseudomonadota bacterium]